MVHQIHLHAERLGTTGPHLIILHGWGLSLESLKPLGNLLAHSFQVHLIDLPGFGKSGHPNGVWDTFDYAKRIVHYMDQQKIDRAHILGHSFGGKTGICLASKHPERVDKLILIAASGLRHKRLFRERCRFQALRWLAKGCKHADSLLGSHFFKEYFIPRFGSIDYRKAGPMRSILVKSVNEDLTTSIASIKSPTLLLWGEQDKETPPEMAHRIHSLIPHSKLFLFPGKGHLVYEDAGGHLCAAYILPFLEGATNHA